MTSNRRGGGPSIKERLADGQVVVGCLVPYVAPWLIEVIGLVGFDFVTFDLEHEPIDNESVGNMVRAADAVGLSAFVRLPATERVLPLLTAGVSGVEVPNVSSRAMAEAAVAATRFRPTGQRSYYVQTRAAGYGLGLDERKWVAEQDEQVFLSVVLEDVAVIDRLDGILSVQGIDGVHIGPGDLSQSMGLPDRAEVQRVIDEWVTRSREAGKYVAIGVVAPWSVGAIESQIAQGVQVFHVAIGPAITHFTGDLLKEIEGHFPDERRRRRATLSVTQNPYLKPQA